MKNMRRHPITTYPLPNRKKVELGITSRGTYYLYFFNPGGYRGIPKRAGRELEKGMSPEDAYKIIKKYSPE